MLALPFTTLQEAGSIAELIRMSMENTPLATQYGNILVTSSFGAAQFSEQSDTLEALLRDADAALYEAKRSGRNCVRLSH